VNAITCKDQSAQRQASGAPWPIHSFKDRDTWVEQVLAGNLSAAEKLVATRIALHHNIETGQCDPSIIGLVKRTNTSESTVRRAIKELEDAGWLAVDRTNGRYRNSYQLHAPTLPLAEGLNPVRGERVQTANPAAGGDQPCQNEVPNPFTSERQTANLKQRIKQRRESDSHLDLDDEDSGRRRQTTDTDTDTDIAADFGAWYQQYPKHAAKVAAFKAYCAVINKKQATPAELLSGAMRYSAERNGQDPKYTKHPATWLYGGCWHDEPARPITSTVDQSGNLVAAPPNRPPPVNAHAARAQLYIDRLKASQADRSAS
jgi:Helix-turn-helix domain